MTNMRAMPPMFIIDNCSTLEDNQELTIILKSNRYRRSLSLINYGEVYKDLSGTIHYSSINYLQKNFFLRSYSCPKNYLSNERSFSIQSPSMTMNFLDPFNGTHSPGGSSSRYSLYGSFFDLSENGYHPSKLSITTTYQDKCKDWLSHLEMK